MSEAGTPDIAATPPTAEAARHRKARVVCAISGKELKPHKAVPLAAIRPALADHIRADHPELGPDAWIGLDVIGDYRSRYVGELPAQGARRALRPRAGGHREPAARTRPSPRTSRTTFAEKRSLGERLADHVASFGGSWTFLISFAVFLGAWMVLNVVSRRRPASIPYPFILLNLCCRASRPCRRRSS